MARQHDTALTFLRCRTCETGVAAITTAIGIQHNEDRTHTLIYPRPEHSQLSMWLDVRAALNNIHQVQFYLGYLPEKPQAMWDHEMIRLQLDDARAVLEQLANGIQESAGS